MGKSRVVQVSNEAISEKEYVTQRDCEAVRGSGSSFVGDVADYVMKDDSREHGINCIFSMLEMRFGEFVHLDREKYTISFLRGFKGKYFEHKKAAFLKLADQLRSGDVEFSDSMFVYDANNIVEDRHNLYIYRSNRFVTFDEFIRDAVFEKTYFIGGTLRYHY